MPLQATSGAASYDAFGGGVAAVPNYIEDVFQTWLYTGNGSTQTITNGIDLAGKGGLVWTKSRSSGSFNHVLVDTVRGAGKGLFSDLTNAQNASMGGLTGFTSTGYELSGSVADLNSLSQTFASWTFREQPKFFDVVTYTGNGASTQVISHNLGSTPGCIIVKSTDSAGDWLVYHRSQGVNKYGYLNGTDLWRTDSTTFKAVSDTTFTVGSWGDLNGSGKTFVAYLFAHNAGGFGLTGTDNVISCGSFTTDGSGNATVNLGYEPQWVLVKNTQTSGTSWVMLDNMRGWTMGNDSALLANLSNAENTGDNYGNPTATGFYINNNGGTWAASNTHIYIAIRRGPMRTPTTGTSVFDPETATASTGTSRTIGFPADMSFGKARTITASNLINDRLRGYANSNTTAPSLFTNTTSAEDPSTTLANVYNVWNTTALDGAYFNNFSTVWYHFRRAPGFFDVVCYTGTGTTTTQTHNLGVAPELMIVKRRNSTTGWVVYSSALAASDYLVLNNTSASQTNSSMWQSTAPTSSVFTVGDALATNASGGTYVNYLFASCPGVSKVGSYTGTGTTQVINCGFTGGARFVLIKRTDSTGDWYVWDSARGIVAGNDPYLLLNSTAAEVTSTDYVDTAATGFELSSTAPAAINANGGTFVFLAIA